MAAFYALQKVFLVKNVDQLLIQIAELLKALT